VSRENAASRRARTTPGHLPANSPWPLRERKPRAGWPDAGATRTVYADGYGTTTSDSVYRPAPSSPFRPSEPDIDSYPSTPSGRELSRWFVASLGLLIAISALSIDIVLPALPAIAREFGVGERSAQYLVTAYLSGFAIGQLPIGLLADRSGRRVVIICALALFIVAGIGAAAATSVPAICGARFVQGLGGACGPVLARAIVRDVGGADHGARLMAMMMAILGLAPLLAPLWFFWSGVTVFVFGLSVSSPVATSIALAPLPGSAGFAASILGAASIATGALGSLASAAFYANDENSMTAVLLLGISGALVLWRVYGRHL
jgi:MFS family permease